MDNKQTFLAKALYDNLAETPDELAFRRGDIVTIIEQDTDGLDGWWLCSLRGKQGIAPGNRMKLLTGMVGNSILMSSSPMREGSSPHREGVEDWNRRNAELTQNKVVTPQKMGDVYIYESPNQSILDYDVPPSHHVPSGSPNVNDLSQRSFYDTPPSSTKSNQGSKGDALDLYDTPPSRIGINVKRLSFDQVDASNNSWSNRSSGLSVLSADSSFTVSSSNSNRSARSSNPTSMCDSARSSMDISPQDLYDVPRSSRAVKQQSADSGLDFTMYESPPKSKIKYYSGSSEDYDVPKSNTYEVPLGQSDSPSASRNSKEQDVEDLYDVPKNNSLRIISEDGCSSNNSTLKGSRSCGTIEAYNRGSNSSLCHSQSHSGLYDIPPHLTRDSVVSCHSDSSDSLDQRLSSCSMDSSYADIPAFSYTELRLDLDAAVDLLIKLQQDIHKATTRLLSYITSSWRRREHLEPRIYAIKLACMCVRTSVEEFLEFAEGTLANAIKVPDKSICKKLKKHVLPLQKSLDQMKLCLKRLDEHSWNINKLIIDKNPPRDDELNQFMAVSKDLIGQVRKLTAYIQGNSTLLFKRAYDVIEDKYETPSSISSDKPSPPTSSEKPPINPRPETAPKPKIEKSLSNVQDRPLPAPPPMAMNERVLPATPDKLEQARPRGSSRQDDDDHDWVDDYDYVHLETREQTLTPCHKGDNDVTTSSPLDRVSPCDDDLKTPVNTDSSHFDLPDSKTSPIKLELNDKQVLGFYSGQLDTHSSLLTSAIDAFFTSIEGSEPPRVFIAHSKFVVLSAHKLVYIGDTLHRNLVHPEIRSNVMQCANSLCDSLKLTVTATKMAALQYPAVVAVQQMVDRVVDVSHASHSLKLVIMRAASL